MFLQDLLQKTCKKRLFITIIIIMKKPYGNARGGGCLFKLIKLGFVALIAILIAAYFSLGYIADYALKTATAGTGVEVGLGSVSFDLGEQKLAINNFYVTNPPGYPQDVKAIAFREAVFDAQLRPAALIGQKLVEIDEIKVVGLTMAVQLKTASGIQMLLSAPKSNLTEISDIFKAKYGLNDDSDPNPQPAQQTDVEDEDSEPMKFIIKKLVFQQGDIVGGLNNTDVKVILPSFTIENLGVKEGGLTVSQLVAKIIGNLAVQGTYNVAKAVVKEGVGLTKDAASGTESAVKDAGKSTVDAVDSAGKAIGNALKKLF